MNINDFFFLLLGLFFIVSCTKSTTDKIDEYADLNREEIYESMNYKDMDRSRYKNAVTITSNSRKPQFLEESLPFDDRDISVSSDGTIDTYELITEIARIGGFDADIGKYIDENVIVNISDRKVDNVLDVLASKGNFRYSSRDNIVYFVHDDPYIKNYNINILITYDQWDALEASIYSIMNMQKQSSSFVLADFNGSDVSKSNVIINRDMGIVTVYGNSKVQSIVSNYLIDVNRHYSAQVLIEAKIVEVKLDDIYSTGVDWTFLKTILSQPLVPSVNISNTQTLVQGLTNGNFTFGVFNGDLNATIKAIDQFGITRTLSSPRIHTTNNKAAKLEFTNNLVYFNVEKEEEIDEDTDDRIITYTTTKLEEKEGIVLEILPSINLEKNEILLMVKPTLTVRTDWVDDPNPDVNNRVPVIQSRTVEAQINIKSGEIMVIGGLMYENSSSIDTGVPEAKDIPVLGLLFRNRDRNIEKKENIILVKATIMDSDTPIDVRDKELYNKMSTERKNIFEEYRTERP